MRLPSHQCNFSPPSPPKASPPHSGSFTSRSPHAPGTPNVSLPIRRYLSRARALSHEPAAPPLPSERENLRCSDGWPCSRFSFYFPRRSAAAAARFFFLTSARAIGSGGGASPALCSRNARRVHPIPRQRETPGRASPGCRLAARVNTHCSGDESVLRTINWR